MPLRDHFRPPVSKRSTWEGFHGGWPMRIIEELIPRLPPGFIAEPRVHLGTYFEIDVCAFEENQPEWNLRGERESAGGVATLEQADPAATLTLETEFPEEYAYEVLIFDMERDRRLVAAIEIVSPANKDRPASRQLFAAKCYNLLRQDVCVSIIDLVSIRQFNLYVELLRLLRCPAAALMEAPPAMYAVTCRKRSADARTHLDVWSYPVVVGQPLPTLPVWLSDTLHLKIDLEASYEETCRILRVS